LLEYGSDILSVTLFGSKARGDDTPHSDIDVLIVVADEDWTVKYQIRTLGARVSLDHDVLFNLYVVERERWVWMQEINHPLYRRITNEGVDLVPATVMNEK
jgi:predicted nucleotidyltransferase